MLMHCVVVNLIIICNTKRQGSRYTSVVSPRLAAYDMQLTIEDVDHRLNSEVDQLHQGGIRQVLERFIPLDSLRHL
jgi:hypothetical protein